MTPLQLALDRAQLRLIDRLDLLVGRADGGDESVYVELRDLTIALAQIRALVAPGAIGELLDTKTMAQRLGVSTKTLLRNRKKPGGVQPAVVLGRRGRAALRWGSA